MRKLFLPLLLACTLASHGQKASQWLSLTPIQVEKPALGNVKDVNNKVFTDAMLLDYSAINIKNLIPDENKNENRFHHLRWTKALTEADTITTEEHKDDFTVNYYATYLSNSEWLKGDFKFQFFGNAEIYVDGVKKATVTDGKKSNKSVTCELVPGKHTIIVKTVTEGGKLFSADFKADTTFSKAEIQFSTSPQRGKNIYDVLNGNRIGTISVSPSGIYAIVGVREIIDGKSSSATNIYRIADKELVYTFYNNTVSNLTWVPGEDRLSFLQKEGNGFSLYAYDLAKKQQTCLIKEDPHIKGYTWSPDRSYLIYYVNENFRDRKSVV